MRGRARSAGSLEQLVLYNVTTPIGALDDNIQYVQMCYEGVIRTDATFNKLFQTNWSRDVIEGGRSLFANAVPGVWMNDSALGKLDSRIYVRGFDAIWLLIIDAIRPPVIYLCGAWAKPLAKAFARDCGIRPGSKLSVIR